MAQLQISSRVKTVIRKCTDWRRTARGSDFFWLHLSFHIAIIQLLVAIHALVSRELMSLPLKNRISSLIPRSFYTLYVKGAFETPHNDLEYFSLCWVQTDVSCEQKVQFSFCFLIQASLIKFFRMICAVCYDPIVFLEQQVNQWSVSYGVQRSYYN